MARGTKGIHKSLRKDAVRYRLEHPELRFVSVLKILELVNQH